MIYFVQGEYLPQEKARIPVFDRGFLYGDSVYETVRAVGGRIIFWDDHAVRLHESANMLGIELEPQPFDLLEVFCRRNTLIEKALFVGDDRISLSPLVNLFLGAVARRGHPFGVGACAIGFAFD